MADADADRPRLTVAMIARNAAPLLKPTLESVRSIADEIVVLDTGSTDDTIPVAQSLGAHIFRQPWDDDFSAARNACLAKTTGDWILWLDAGERLAAETAAFLREFVDRRAMATEAYLLPVALPAARGQIGGEQIYQVRLHPLEEGVAFAGRVRERVEPSLAAAKIAIKPMEITILRTARDHDEATKASRAQRNIRIADLAVAEDGPTAELQNCLGEALQSLGDPLRAAQQYYRALQLAAAGSRESLEAYYGLLTCLNSVKPERSEQLSLCLEALEHFPLDAQLLVTLGGYLQASDQPQLAMRSYDVAFRHGQIEPQIWHLPDIREIAALCAVNMHLRTGSIGHARTLLEAALQTFPLSERLAAQLNNVEALRQKPPSSSASNQAIRVDSSQTVLEPSLAPVDAGGPSVVRPRT